MVITEPHTDDRPPGDDRPLVVAEFTTNHLGNRNLLERMVEAAATKGCDLIKMQKKDVDSFYSDEKLDAPFDSPYGRTYREYRRTFEFGREDFERFDQHCRQFSVPWFATAQDVPSLEFLLNFDLPLLKVASCNARNLPFLKEVALQAPADTGLVLSIAGSTIEAVDSALEVVADRTVYLLHCVAEYPTAPERARLGNLTVLRERYERGGARVGYSGHEVGMAASAAAMDLGARMVERHFCVSRHSFAHHIECSLEPDELATLVHLAHTQTDRADSYRALPPSAFDTHFGMTAVEHEFLVAQGYGQFHLGTRSGFHG